MYSEARTISMCPTCYREIPATVFFRDGQVWMQKNCHNHGETLALVEPDEMFYRTAKNPDYRSLMRIIGLTITRRCNMNCPHCYSGIDDKLVDEPLESLMETARTFDFPHLCLYGGEPTLRNDLFDLVRALRSFGKEPHMISNGLKLSDISYIKDMFASGLTRIGMSVNTRAYNGEKLYERKLQTIENYRTLGAKFYSMGFTLASLDDVPEVIDSIRSFSDVSSFFRVRSGTRVGLVPDDHQQIFVSSLLKKFQSLAEVKPMNHWDNHPYHYNILLDGKIPVRLIKCPDVTSVDLGMLDPHPCLYARDGRVHNFVKAVIINEGMAKGWLAGKRIKELEEVG